MEPRVFVIDGAQRAIAACQLIASNWMEALRRKQPLVVTIEPAHRQRSTQQNKRYWALLGEIAAAAEINGQRFSTETWHHFLKQKFIGLEDVVLPDGQVIHQPISSTKLSTAEFNSYMERIEAYAASELGVEFATT